MMTKKINFSNFITTDNTESHLSSKEVHELSVIQKKAIIKAVLYIISADGIITEEEKAYFTLLVKELNVSNSLIRDSIDIDDEDMFETLQGIGDKEFLIQQLNKAAMVDNNFAEEEKNLIATFIEYIPKGSKPKEFYNKILNF
ncbi:hypothetical protein HMPREF0650_0667 [Hoylesella buccalis ATCC 35310]|uniref:Co-chaperone DjlA N-terminal domain-containing protein n=1 Tax=Hoylesella buccalis ATCC 35310 TaxID=679190 RepID=D1W835_9BACT|nr:TerB family tellurite resistance protein [Hoylesella buccalis]EFA91397.1 hypothetical protein HMPREF0650_0667 [Hoylesella buccalis ATCC 35310]